MNSSNNPFLLVGPKARVVNHNGTLYFFNPSEARAFEIFLKAWESGVPARKGFEIIETLESSKFRLQEVFKHKSTGPKRKWTNPAWGTLITPTPELRGFYQLNLETGTVITEVTTEQPVAPPAPLSPRQHSRKRASLARITRNGSK